MDRLSRVISIMIDLINHDIVDTSYLSNKYEVSTRTIYRDIELLNLSGIPIVSKQGKNGGFSVLDGFRIDKNILSEEEFSILVRGLQTLINDDDKKARLVYDKILSILSGSKKEKIIQTSNHIVIDVSPFEEIKQIKENYQKIDKAIKDNKCIKIIYYSDRKETTRVVEPYMLIYKTTNWYMYAYCRKRNDFRYFKLYRIKELEILDESFEKKEIESNPRFNFFDGLKEETIVLKTYEKYLTFMRENFAVIKEEIKKDGVLVTLRYPMNEWVYSALLGMGQNVEIVSPKYIKSEIVKRIDAMKEIYNKE